MVNKAEEFAKRIVQTLQDHGHIAYFAGGCVRDRLMGRVPADYDVATSATPEQVQTLFPKSLKVGAAFGVVIVRERPPSKLQAEVATFRTDGQYVDGRHPEEVIFATPEEDAQRRDFTCNGLFYDPVYREIHDFVGGQIDISEKTLRAIGDPFHRFMEDHLRMLRAVRFAAKLNFTIESSTYNAIKSLVQHIRSISKERIGEELRMILAHFTRVQAVELARRLGLLQHIWPAIVDWSNQTGHAGGERLEWIHLGSLEGTVSRSLGFLAMQMDLGLLPTREQVDQLRDAFMLSNLETEELAFWSEKLPIIRDLEVQAKLKRSTWKRIMASPHWPGLYMLWTAGASQERNARRKKFVEDLIAESQQWGEGGEGGGRGGIAPEPLVSGNDLIKLGATPGPDFKRWLDILYDAQLDLELTSRQQALEKAKALLAESKNTAG